MKEIVYHLFNGEKKTLKEEASKYLNKWLDSEELKNKTIDKTVELKKENESILEKRESLVKKYIDETKKNAKLERKIEHLNNNLKKCLKNIGIDNQK